MWSDPPRTAVGDFCFGYCTDAGIDYLNKLLDNPANDARPFGDLRAEADKFQRDTYIRSHLTAEALKLFPLDPADDPSFLKCEPYGFARQIFSRHQLEMRAQGNDRIEMRYGEWDVRRTVYMNGQKPSGNVQPSQLGHSVGHWEGQTLVIETSGISPNIIFGNNGTKHSERLRAVERYTRSEDGKTLMLTATMEDPWSLKEPVVMKKIWSWAPDQKIAAYTDCERPTNFKKGTNR